MVTKNRICSGAGRTSKDMRPPAQQPQKQRNFPIAGAMTLHRTLALVALCALTAGCGSSREQLAQRNSERCAASGLAPNSDAFNQCVNRLETERSSRMESRRLEMMERSGVPPSAMR